MERSRWELIARGCSALSQESEEECHERRSAAHVFVPDGSLPERVLREIAVGRQIAAERGYHGHIRVDEALSLFDEDCAPVSPARLQ